MIRVVVFLVVIGVLAFGAAWLEDRPGEVVISWQGWRVETSVAMLAIAVASITALALLAWSILRAILRSRAVLRQRLRERRARRGYLALSQGLIAVGSGDARAARRFADEAGRIAPGEPLTLLLGAQAAQLAGDRAVAERTFKTMASRDDTRLFGLHGLFIEAQRRRDPAAARLIAEEAARSDAAPGWAGLAVLEFRCAAGDWTGALDRLERNQKSGLVDKATYQRQRAVLLTARALAAEPTDRGSARMLALGAVKLAPTLVPAAALAGRLLGEAGELRQAARIIEAAWAANPHPDLADTYAHLRPGDSARDRLARVQALARIAPDNIESALAVVLAALDAREFAIARTALAPLAGAPTQRVALLFAKLEELEHADEGRAREWMTRAVRARRDPVWTADGFVSDRWLPVSPVTGRLDAFRWMEPLAQLGATEAPVIEVAEEPVAIAAPAAPPIQPAPTVPPEPIVTSPPEPPRPETPAVPAAPPRNAIPAAPAANFEKVIPLIHAPDDPGPDGEPHAEPVPDPPPPPSNGWDRLRALFK
ncbi:MAG TPA: heme biosynthesis HemY N-terminal domain-containing protein [Xanthobacteraceae bacterium]|jgi:HemY protein